MTFRLHTRESEHQGGEMERLELKPGTVIHICGWPVETVGVCVVTGHPGNLELVRRDLYLPVEKTGPSEFSEPK
jgi:hypothetical protein